MSRDLLDAILNKAPGVSVKNGVYHVEGEHRASLYLVSAGHMITIADIARLWIDGDLVVAEGRDRTHHFFPVDFVQGFAVKPPRAEIGGRTGF